jgi:DNA-binding XRE family transcriptional regulator
MESHEIKVEIYRRRPQGLTMTAIAKKVGVSKQAISLIIERRQTSRRIAQAIADAIELPIEQVFPELYKRPFDNEKNVGVACN